MKPGDKVRYKDGDLVGTIFDVKIHKFLKDGAIKTSVTYQARDEDHHNRIFMFHGSQVGKTYFKFEENEEEQLSIFC